MNRKDTYKRKRRNTEKYLNGVKLEKGDETAIIIAALTTIIPFAIGIIMIYVLLIKLIFRI